jgi:molybdopterin/thiamine biosynthesis adenylyltransferase
MTMRLRIPSDLYEELIEHLFPGDLDEHGAVLLAGLARDGDEVRLLARELHLAGPDEFIPGTFGYRQLSPLMVAQAGGRADNEQLIYLSCHSHPGANDQVSFSSDDNRAHKRLFPHLLDLSQAPLVGGLVFGTNSIAGDIWGADGTRVPLDETVVVGQNLLTLTAQRTFTEDEEVSDRFDRQARLFGAAGQRRLRNLHVGVIGAGGGGSLIVEQLAHLGVGKLTVIDFDRVEITNLSRIVGATREDAEASTLKVEVARRLVSAIDPEIGFRGLVGDIADEAVAKAAAKCDFLFLATDTVRARLVFNALTHQYLIPGIQIGSKVEVAADGSIEEIYVAVRPVLPMQGCLDCAELIDPYALHREQRSDEEALAQDYVGATEDEAVIDPSVISLNSISAAHAVTSMFMAVTRLAQDGCFDHRLFFPREGATFAVPVKKREQCLFCGHSSESVLARGDTRPLPVRITRASAVPVTGDGGPHQQGVPPRGFLTRTAQTIFSRVLQIQRRRVP